MNRDDINQYYDYLIKYTTTNSISASIAKDRGLFNLLEEMTIIDLHHELLL